MSFGRASKASSDTRVSLRTVLRRAHFRVALVTMAGVALCLTLAATLALRSYAKHNEDLLARSIAYTAEAAVVFRDEDAIREVLQMIGVQESLGNATILSTSGEILGRYSPAAASLQTRLAASLQAWLLPEPGAAPIVYQGRTIAQVSLRDGGAGLLQFVAAGLLSLLVCMALCFVAVRHLSDRLRREIMQPVKALMNVTHSARKALGQPHRAPASPILELHELGEDFNALLSEIEAHQTQLRQENKSLSHQANHDSLTGLPNRAHFRRRLHRLLQDAESNGTRVGVLYLDNDHFKSINDRFGHAAGDALLVEVAQRVTAQLRETDLVARLGGDEFAVLLSPLQNDEDAERIADKILHSMHTPLSLRPGEHIVPSLSIGIAVYPSHGATIETLLRAADLAMYRVKSQQRGSRHLYNATTDTTDFEDLS
ncbi:diguanylate cyclase domain-containing protein [Variovorax sp. HJSM1_2]|uniref:diguanylate cyclase domain-containing protein n=1 Tax=Variovorax sp. HJSM1_2 TaxID=3366263 RepID=UPI003BE141E9